MNDTDLPVQIAAQNYYFFLKQPNFCLIFCRLADLTHWKRAEKAVHDHKSAHKKKAAPVVGAAFRFISRLFQARWRLRGWDCRSSSPQRQG